MRCLIVEDNEDLAALLKCEMTSRGVLVATAGTRAEATRMLLARDFDLIVTDLVLPDGDGVSVADLAAFRMPDAPVVVLTGSVDYGKGELFFLSPSISAVFRKSADLRDFFAFVEHEMGRVQAAPSPDQEGSRPSL